MQWKAMCSVLNLSTPLLTGSRGPLINTSTFRELTVFNRSTKSRFSTSDCCFTTSFDPMCSMIFFTVGCVLPSQRPYPSENRVFWCFYCTCLLHLLQESHLQSEFEAHLWAFNVAFFFLSYFESLPCCVNMRYYPGHQTTIQGPATVAHLVVGKVWW